MYWSQLRLARTTLMHLEQDENSQQCVIASLAMLQSNNNFFFPGNLFVKRLYSFARTTMMAVCDEGEMGGGMADNGQFISHWGIRPDAIYPFLLRSGYHPVREVNSRVYGANYVSQQINTMKEGETMILVCGLQQFHAMAAFKKNNSIFIMNPMPENPEARACCYTNGKNATKACNDVVLFADPCEGLEPPTVVSFFYKFPINRVPWFTRKRYK